MSKFTLPFPGHPEIYPLVLTTKTQEIFNCRVDEDVTEEQPYKLIKKEDIFADFANRAAVSDFYPVKKIVQVGMSPLFIFQPYLKRFLIHNRKSWRDSWAQIWHFPLPWTNAILSMSLWESFSTTLCEKQTPISDRLFYSTPRKARSCPILTRKGTYSIFPYCFDCKHS